MDLNRNIPARIIEILPWEPDTQYLALMVQGLHEIEPQLLLKHSTTVAAYVKRLNLSLLLYMECRS